MISEDGNIGRNIAGNIFVINSGKVIIGDVIGIVIENVIGNIVGNIIGNIIGNVPMNVVGIVEIGHSTITMQQTNTIS
jgi:hypothetical protein